MIRGKRNRNALFQIYLYPHELQQIREISIAEGIGASTWARSQIMLAVRRYKKLQALELEHLEQVHKRRARDVQS